MVLCTNLKIFNNIILRKERMMMKPSMVIVSPKVYVVQEARGRNLIPATNYGTIEVLLPPGNVAFSSFPTVRRLNDKLRNFSDKDYLLLMGDPAAIAMAGAIAANNNRGNMKLLKWDKQETSYYVVEVNLYKGELDE